MIKNNKISEFLDQYGNELRRMGIYILIITFIFGLSLKVIGDRTRIVPPENRQAEGPYIEVDFPDPQIPESITVIVDQPEDNLEPIIGEERKTEQKSVEPQQEVEEQPKVIPEEEEVTKDIPEASEEIPLEDVTEETEVHVNATMEGIAFSWPVSGDIINPYGLTYSQTFADYRFNPGIDIKAAPGTEIKAALAGQVVQVETNQNEKTSITIEHEPGVCSRYSHLEQSLVKIGDKVKTCQVIGKAGSPGLAKSAEDSLLHFQIKNGDKNLDPTQYIR